MKNILCYFNIHKWKTKKTVKASNLIFLLKKSKGILKRSTFKLDKDYVIEDKECIRCGKETFEINDTKKYLEEMLVKSLKKK